MKDGTIVTSAELPTADSQICCNTIHVGENKEEVPPQDAAALLRCYDGRDAASKCNMI